MVHMCQIKVKQKKEMVAQNYNQHWFVCFLLNNLFNLVKTDLF